MIKLEMRTSPRLVQQVGAIERFAGIWERLSLSDAVASDGLFRSALQSGAEECFKLDGTSPAGLARLIEVERSVFTKSSSAFVSKLEGFTRSDSTKQVSSPGVVRMESILPGNLSPIEEINSSPLTAYINAHLLQAEFDLEGINSLFQAILPREQASPRSPYRATSTHFTAPGLGLQGDEIVFPTVSPFLVEQRYGELLEWTRHELSECSFHPLFIIGTFHLLFLQIHPFHTANHRLSLLLLFRLLDSHGYSFVRYSHFAPEMSARARQYFSALRQAEKTASGNWSTLNIWLEFFLDTLIQASEHLLNNSERTVNSSRLTTVQKKIIDVVKANGTVSRERIVNETGINLSTVKYNLSVLASKGHLKRDGGGRTTSYRIL